MALLNLIYIRTFIHSPWKRKELIAIARTCNKASAGALRVTTKSWRRQRSWFAVFEEALGALSTAIIMAKIGSNLMAHTETINVTSPCTTLVTL